MQARTPEAQASSARSGREPFRPGDPATCKEWSTGHTEQVDVADGEGAEMAQARAARMGREAEGQRLVLVKAVLVVAITVALAGTAAAAGFGATVPGSDVDVIVPVGGD